ncbi:MAG: hypothetical protein HON04_06640, partial [Planctomicrobium sp.]|nr:hypothetical protein [Planctomicrobium sp.]
MSQQTATIALQHPDEARLLFGPADSHLRRIRESIGSTMVLRGEHIVLEGTEEQLRETEDVFEQMRDVIKRDGIVHERMLERILADEV